MTWFRIDDSFYDHPKVLAIPPGLRPAAKALWLDCGAWSARHLTDGFVPEPVALAFVKYNGGRRALTLLETLIKVGLWDATTEGVIFHDWLDYNPSRQQVLAARNLASDRQKRRRRRLRGDDPEDETPRTPVTRDSRVTSRVSHAAPTRPGPNTVVTFLVQLSSQRENSQTTTSENSAEYARALTRWREFAGPDVDLAAEADAWLTRAYTGGMPDDPAAAWLGWLRVARERAEAASVGSVAPAPKPIGCDGCDRGWAGEDAAGRPIPCPVCKPNVIRIRRA